MKKLLLPLIILAAGAAASGRFTQLASEARASTHRREAECSAVSAGLAQLSAEKAALQNEIKAGQERLSRSSSPDVLGSGLLDPLAAGQSNHWPDAALPELRRRLGIAWDNSPDYVLVSKAALKGIPMNGVGNRGVLTPTVCDVLAITPEERASLEALMQRSEATYFGWVQANVQRFEPSGDIVAKYVIPANPGLAQRLMMEGGVGVLGAVGAERTELCRNFATDWVLKHGFLGLSSVSLTVQRLPQGGQPRLQAKCDTTGHGTTGWADLTPASFPELFRAVVPGGWRELAQRDNFELPADFQDAPPPQ
jgi:hypothetical protein